MVRLMGILLLVATLAPVAAAPVAAAGARAPPLHPDRLFDSRALIASVSDDPVPSLTLEQNQGNPRLAMLYSLLLPGLGEYTLGYHGRATIFFVAEGAIWTSYAVFRSQGSHRKNLYREFAQVHAEAKKRDDDDYYRTIGNYIASDGPFSANEQVRREARALNPDNRAAQDQYFEDHAYTGDDAWRWESAELLDRYTDMRDSSISAYHHSEFSIGFMVASRLISVVDTGLLAARRKREAKPETGFHWGIEAEPTGAHLTVSRTF